MQPMHSLLKLQLKRCFGDNVSIPPEWQGFVEAIDEAYRKFDVGREKLERSLESDSDVEGNYRSIFENACEGIFQTTPDGQFITANPAMARILGFNSPEALIRGRKDIATQGYVQPGRRDEFKRR